MGTYGAIVIGGGVAGISCANALAEQGLKVCLLEARDRLGGRLFSCSLRACDGEEHVLHHGGAWIHGVDATNPVAATLRDTCSSSSRVASTLSPGHDLNPWLHPHSHVLHAVLVPEGCLLPEPHLDAAIAAYQVHAAAAQVESDATPLASAMSTWGVTACEQALWRAHTAWFGSDERVHTTSDVALHDAGDLKGAHALLCTPAHSLTHTHAHVTVLLTSLVTSVTPLADGTACVATSTGARFIAPHVCVCVPAPLLTRSPWRDVLSACVGDARDRFTALSRVSTCLYSRTYVLLHAGEHAHALMHTKAMTLPVYAAGATPALPVAVIENHTALHARDDTAWPSASAAGMKRSHVCLCVCIVRAGVESGEASTGHTALQIEANVRDAVAAFVSGHTLGRARVCSCAEPACTCAGAVRIEAMQSVRWEDDPLTLGAYPCMSGVEDAYESIQAYSRPAAMAHGAVMYFASDACNAAYMGSMHGAMMAGARAARQVMKRRMPCRPAVDGGTAHERVCEP